MTADPELRKTQSDISTCRFNVAVNRKYKNEQTGDYDADFITCVAWRQTADFVARYFTKGKMIALEGSLRSGNYQDRNHPDVTHYTTEVYVDNVEFCGDKGDKNSSGHSAAQSDPSLVQNAMQSTQKNAAANTAAEEYLDLSDFEEVLSDGDVPF